MTATISNLIDSNAGIDNPFADLNAFLSQHAHDFLRPTPEIQRAAISTAKHILDPLAALTAHTQATRRNEHRRKRRRQDEDGEEPILQLKQIYTEGFGVKQIWEQAQRVLEAARFESERQLGQHVAASQLADEAESDIDDHLSEEEISSDASMLDGESSDEAIDELTGVQRGQSEEEAEDDDIMNEDNDEEFDMHDSESEAKQDTFIPDPNGLNDGFFSIDDFNKQSQFLEQMDARGDDDNPSDEDEVDWGADPMSMSLPSTKMGGSARDKTTNTTDGDDSDEDEDGPTFGDADFNAPDTEDEDRMEVDGDQDIEDGMGLSNANDVKYADFFEPPPKKQSKTKRMRALPKTQPKTPSHPNETNEAEIQNDIERAMADVRRDLLDSEDEDDFGEDSDASSNNGLNRSSAKPSDKNLSTHEKQRVAIAAEIRRLEAANVSKRDWQLSGEARAAERPLNSLIEEDLEFERAGKPVPVVTAETSEEIEQLIKRRILAREFDELVRRHATATGSAGETRRGRVEIDDQKASSGLADVYEQEHLKISDPASYVDKRSAATKKQHEQIDILWREVNEQLNLLSNLHFKPKRVDVQLTTVEDKPRIAMEDARPVGEFESGDGGMLAPQEVYKPGLDSKLNRDEVQMGKNGGSTMVNREEMTREEKLRRRRREKERTKKAQGNQEQLVLGKDGQTRTKKKKGKVEEKADIFADLKKGNVKIVGKDGELQNLSNKKKPTLGRSEQAQGLIGGNLKL